MKKNICNWLSGSSVLILILGLAWLYFFPVKTNSGLDNIALIVLVTIIICASSFLCLLLGIFSLIRKEPARVVTWIFLVINAVLTFGLFFLIFGIPQKISF